MAIDQNNASPKTMDADLFKTLDEGLRSIFQRNVEKDKRNYSSDQMWGMTAAKAAQSLIDLHAKFTPQG